MTSRRKIETNQRNSKKSTGPKSKRGKKMSSINALTTGMYSNTLLLPDENVEAYLALNEDLFEELKPVGRFEEEIVRQIIFDY